MTASLVFNHHSLPCDSIEEADRTISDFLLICIKAKNAGLLTILMEESIDTSWFRLELSQNYFWQDWYRINETASNKEIIRAFRSIATKSPLFTPADIDEGADLFDVSINGTHSYSAVRAAVWHSVPLISFPTQDLWTNSPLLVKVDKLELSLCELQSSEEYLKNFYTYSVFEKELPLLIEQRNALINSGKELYQKKGQLFPNIIFCGKSQQQLNSWSASLTIINQVTHSLERLNSFVEKWRMGLYSFYSAATLRELGLSYNVNGESETVRNTPRLREERIFRLPSGHKAFFEEHIKLSSGYRLHFFPDNIEKSIYIGYIGPHLKLK